MLVGQIFKPIHLTGERRGRRGISFDKFSAPSAFSCKTVWGFGCGCAALCALCPKNSGSVIPKPERQKQKFSWLHGLLNPALPGSGNAGWKITSQLPACLASNFLPGLRSPLLLCRQLRRNLRRMPPLEARDREFVCARPPFALSPRDC